MNTRIFVFSSILCLCGTMNAGASECMGAGCDVEPVKPAEAEVKSVTFDEFAWINETQNPTTVIIAKPKQVVVPPTWMEADPNAAAVPDVEPVARPPQNINAKLLTIKPVPEDTRPKLWDGSNGEYAGADGVKTVDWRDGVPIWDESINNYKYKDFSDWFLEPSPEIYLREADAATTISPTELYQQNMADAAATRARIEDLLAPKKPEGNLWFANAAAPRPEYVAQDMTEIVWNTFYDDGCPFDSQTECEIWRRKPIVRESVSPRSSKIRSANMDEFLDAAHCNKHITANEPVSAPLLDRYKMLMRSAQACCTDGLVYSLKQAGASDGLVYKFMADDANFYGFGARCLMMTDKELDTKYPNTATAVVAADVRNGCLCRGRQWFSAMLAPFEQAYNAMPEFKNAQFNYTYTDGLQRQVTVSVNNDVQNVLKQLALCP
ncbi:MAG: hypothetical protein IKL37_05065 [Alphaproteobacteria bacterium]|nr:hypothetical protein [Alphaproteobacteria bacterium]